jgi:predicted neuraminidase
MEHPSPRSFVLFAALAVALVAALWRAGLPTEPRFAMPAQRTHEGAAAPAAEGCSFVALPAFRPSAHASMLAAAPDGSLLAAWFTGSREGAADVVIQFARIREGAVQEAWTALTRPQLQAMVGRVVRKLGNPVPWFDASGRLHLFVVSVSYGGWSGSTVNHLQSDDGGRTWASARRLVLAPFLNLSTLVRNPPVAMADGGIGLPAYHEFIHKHGLWVRLGPDGRVLQATRMPPAAGGALQPAVAPLPGPGAATDALAVLRTAAHGPIGTVRTANGGLDWSGPGELGIPNPDSGTCMVALADGSLLMAANPLQAGRNELRLFRSLDGGTTWTPSRTIERSADPKAEFSYPALAQDASGTVHLSWTWMRKGIRVASFAPAWLEAGDADAPAAPAMAGLPAAAPAPSAAEPPLPRWSLPMAYGLFAQALLVAAAARLAWRALRRPDTRVGRALPWFAAVVVLLVQADGIPLAAHLRGLWGDPAVATSALLAWWLLARDLPQPPAAWRSVAAAVVIAAFLYAPAFLGISLGALDVHAGAWTFPGAAVAAIGATVLLLALRAPLPHGGIALTAIVLLAYAAGAMESDNPLDYAVDPLLLAGMAASGLGRR